MSWPTSGLTELPTPVLHALAERCRAANYTETIFRTVAGIQRGSFDGGRLVLARRDLAAEDPVGGVLALLFACEDGVEPDTARAALGADLLGPLIEYGVLADTERGIVARFMLVPLAGLWILADPVSAGRDAVMPPGPTTSRLARMIPPQAGPVLDLGCGPGSLALVAAHRGAPAVGTDVNARAIELARINARLNDLAADFAVGDLFAPVGDERFALVVSQPPYVVQPTSTPRVTFLHGGPRGVELGFAMLRDLPAHLAPGGLGLVLMDVPRRPDEPLHAPLRAVLGESAVDLLVMAGTAESPDELALAYASAEAPDGGPAYAAAVERYTTHLQSEGITDLAHVLITLRAPVSPTHHRFTATLPIMRFDGTDFDSLARVYAALDIAARPDAELLDLGLQTASETTWREERTGPDHELPATHTVRFPDGRFADDITLTEGAYHLAALVHRAPTLADAVAALDAETGEGPDSARRRVLGFVREGLGRGLLEPRGD